MNRIRVGGRVVGRWLGLGLTLYGKGKVRGWGLGFEYGKRVRIRG